MKAFLSVIILTITMASCQNTADQASLEKEIFQTEKAFEKMASEKGIAEAFYYYAAEDAVIKRENDTLIIGKKNIKTYYEKINDEKTTVSWTPDYINMSADGTMAYTYGKYLWKIKDEQGEIAEYKGVFHTVWKKQEDKSWKYVWD
jgi:ketosteroid isomerase-like protein